MLSCEGPSIYDVRGKGERGTDFPAYSDTVYSDTPLTVTPRLQWHFWHVTNDRVTTKLPLVTVTIWLQ